MSNFNYAICYTFIVSSAVSGINTMSFDGFTKWCKCWVLMMKKFYEDMSYLDEDYEASEEEINNLGKITEDTKASLAQI